ncbi:restriction endonuclease [Mycoplasmatota bacterium]|nr:restriction endonuclease [Mycoplasmatota bacterium]
MQETEAKFYVQPLLTWFLLVVYPPFGILFLWIIGHYDVLIRISLSLLFGLIYLEFLGFYSSFIRASIYSLIFAYILYRYYKIKEYEEKIHTLFNDALNDLEVNNIIQNYFKKFAPPTNCFNDCLYFELYLRKKYTIIYKHLTLSHKEDTFINIVYQASDFINNVETIIKKDVNEEKIVTINKMLEKHKAINEHYDQELNHLSTILSEKLKLTGDKFILYFTWELIKQSSIHYYADLFKEKYGDEFKSVDLSIMNDVLLKYVSLDYLHIDKNSKDLTMFTYFLMKYGAYKENNDYYTCLNTIYNSLDEAYKDRKYHLFKKHLFHTSDELIKEIETIEVINEMKSKDRFMIFVSDLLKSLGYDKINKPINNYIDYIVSSNDSSFGIQVVYRSELDEKLKSEVIQDLKLGLTINELKKGIIITNGSFTPDATKLAEINNIMLWDKDKLKEKGLLAKRFFKHQYRIEPTNEIKFDDLTSIPFNKITMDTIDKMSGYEFQYYLAELLNRKGYKILSIMKSHDKGVDIILEKNSLRFGIQAKRNKNNINQHAIKEIVAGIPTYSLHGGYVITNQYFTEEAKRLANACNITLWDRKYLETEIQKI